MDLFRWVVFGIFGYAAVVASGRWLLQTRRLSPFGKGARTLKSISDPVLDPIETWLLKRGGNPQKAPQWLMGGTVVGGIVAISLVEWLTGQLIMVTAAGRSGPRDLIRVIVFYAGQALTISIFIRVIASWFGVGRFNPLMKPFYFLTDWIIEPLRRRIPPMGMIDMSPIIAYFGVQILVSIIVRAI
jgi:YggT family protein